MLASCHLKYSSSIFIASIGVFSFQSFGNILHFCICLMYPREGRKSGEFWNGKFLRDVKTQLSAFSILHPNATYDDVVDAFGLPEEVVEEFLNSQDSSQLHNKVLIHGYIRLIFYGILIALALFVIGTYIFFFFTLLL